MSADRQRWPAATAIKVAQEICALLKPACERIVVAGSLRRMKQEVGDVEILYIPILELAPDPADMFASITVNLAAAIIGEMLRRGVLTKRLASNGNESWGEKNKLAVHVATGIPVDLFAATAENWWNYLVCRTGPAESNMRIATRAQQMGWKWHPYGAGFSRGGPLAGESEEHRVTSEEDVFRFVNLPYRKPEGRR